MLYNSKLEIDSNELSNVLHMLLIMELEILDGWTQAFLDIWQLTNIKIQTT